MFEQSQKLFVLSVLQSNSDYSYYTESHSINIKIQLLGMMLFFLGLFSLLHMNGGAREGVMDL